MQPTDSRKLVAGVLLTGASLLTGNALLAGLAGSIGGNWASEGLAGLWAAGASALTTSGPLSGAYERAVRKAVSGLRKQYIAEAGPLPDANAFDLLRDVAGSVSAAQFPSRELSVVTAQQALEHDLNALLYGHDERQQRFIKANLLPVVALAFRDELANDPPAWQRFHGWLIEATAQNTVALRHQFERLPELIAWLERITDQEQALDAAAAQLDALLDALRAEIARLAAEQSAEPMVTFRNTGMDVKEELRQTGGDMFIGRPPAALPQRSADPRPRPSVVFDNQNVKVGGSASQAGGDMYIAAEPQVTATPNPESLVVLAVFSNPPDTLPLRLEQEERALRDCLDPLHERFRLEVRTSVSPDDLHQALLRHRPAILHVSGHGEADGLLFETRYGEQHLVPREALVTMLANTPSLLCVVLNACHSAVHAEGSTLGAPYLVAMRGTVEDTTARVFTQGFYDALGAGHKVEAAFKAGLDRIAVNTLPDADVPRLFRRE